MALVLTVTLELGRQAGQNLIGSNSPRAKQAIAAPQPGKHFKKSINDGRSGDFPKVFPYLADKQM
jgi:hypothetical protein